ncbi:MAG: Crp/Fnr family transcriptional regulator, partial [Flexistipes sinusarabici]
MALVNHLKTVEPFRNLPDAVADFLREKSIVKEYPKNKIIFSQYDKPTGYLYFINKGQVEIFSET